jgi:hypothetical protein
VSADLVSDFWIAGVGRAAPPPRRAGADSVTYFRESRLLLAEVIHLPPGADAAVQRAAKRR